MKSVKGDEISKKKQEKSFLSEALFLWLCYDNVVTYLGLMTNGSDSDRGFLP